MRKGDFLFFAQKMIIYNQSTCAPLPFFNMRFDKYQNALCLLKFCQNNYGYVNSDSALLPYISAFYKSNSRRSIIWLSTK